MSCTWLDTLRKPKILNMSIFDWLLTLLGSFTIGHLVYSNYKMNYWNLVFPAGHRLHQPEQFGCDTKK